MNINTSDYSGLCMQAEKTAEQYLDSTIQIINKYFGEGYAKDNPILVGNLVHVMATDFQSMALSKTMTVSSERLGHILSGN